MESDYLLQLETQPSSDLVETTSLYKRLKLGTYTVLEGHCAASWTFSIVITTIIFVNVILFILSTVDGWYERFYLFLKCLEILTVVVFSLEYILRLWCITESELYRRPIVGRLKFMCSLGSIVDLLSIGTYFYLAVWLSANHLAAAMRLTTFIISPMKIERYARPFTVLWKALKQTREVLFLFLLMYLSVLIVNATILYYAFRDSHPETFSSIPGAMWVCVLMLSGSEEFVEQIGTSIWGKVITLESSILAVFVFAIPSAMLGDGFYIVRARAARASGSDISSTAARDIESFLNENDRTSVTSLDDNAALAIGETGGATVANQISSPPLYPTKFLAVQTMQLLCACPHCHCEFQAPYQISFAGAHTANNPLMNSTPIYLNLNPNLNPNPSPPSNSTLNSQDDGTR